MYRIDRSIPYDILHGIRYRSNISTILTLLSYFPPPPPIIPGPLSRRSWTCSTNSFSSLSCYVPNDYNSPSLRKHIPLVDVNPSPSLKNRSHISANSQYPIQTSTSTHYIINLFQKQFLSTLVFALLLSLLILVIFVILLVIYFQRYRQRQLTSNNGKDKKFYYRLLLSRQNTSQTKRHSKECASFRARNHCSASQVSQMSIENRTQTNYENEQTL